MPSAPWFAPLSIRGSPPAKNDCVFCIHLLYRENPFAARVDRGFYEHFFKNFSRTFFNYNFQSPAVGNVGKMVQWGRRPGGRLCQRSAAGGGRMPPASGFEWIGPLGGREGLPCGEPLQRWGQRIITAIRGSQPGNPSMNPVVPHPPTLTP